MIAIRPMTQLSLADFSRIACGYSSDGRYDVTYRDSDEHTVLELQLTRLVHPYIKKYEPLDAEALRRYSELLGNGFSFGAFDNEILVGLVISEPREWNRSVWVWEFHVAESHRGRGIGRQLMDSVVDSSRRQNFRTIVCETQNTNATAIKIYRKLGFAVEGVDISYYTNNDYPAGEVAVFMKRRL